MKFHLDFKPQKPGFEIDHSNSIFLIGSCFSENIGQLLKDSHFNISSNPYGVLFNPISIAHCIQNGLRLAEPSEQYFLNRGNSSYSYASHSSVNAKNPDLLRQVLQTINKATHTYLKNAHTLIITFGSAYYYKHREHKLVVANCHKQPSQAFTKELLSVDEIVSLYKNLLTELHEHNPELQLIFTVSPVKHLRDGVIENNRSKATLILAIHELVAQTKNCTYFPAYELVNDDLRDYRFYKEDLAHPNALAINYVWDKFSDLYFSPKTKEINSKLGQLHLSVSHKNNTANPDEESKHLKHVNKLKAELKDLLPGRFNML